MRFRAETTKSRQDFPRRWWPAGVIAGVGVAGFAIVQGGFVQVSDRPAVDALLVAVAAEVLLAGWITLFAPVRLIARAQLLVALAAVQAGVLLSIRLDGFAGDGRMILAWRWTPGPETVWEAPESRASGDEPVRTQPVDLSIDAPGNWPAFRGADRSGTASDARLARDWRRHPPRLLWRRKVGAGWSSFAVAGRYCVTQEQRGEWETVVCYELHTGRQRWTHANRACFAEGTGGNGPRATPAIQGGRVYALGATGILNCLDGATGRPIWQVNILEDAGVPNAPFGMAGSPLVEEGMVIVAPGGSGSALAAYDAQTGRPLWRGGSGGAAYSSPHRAEFRAPPGIKLPASAVSHSILNFNAAGLFGHDPSDGSVQWFYPWVTPPEDNNVCQPVPLPAVDAAAAGAAMISSGYGRGAALIELVPGPAGYEVRERWLSRRLRAKFASLVVRDGFAYGLDENRLTCVDLATGERRWREGRYGFGQLILADDLLLVQTEPGDVVLVEATPEEHRELARLPALQHRTWNHPALAGNILLVRNDREAACYELATRPTRESDTRANR